MQTLQSAGASMITTLQGRADSVAPWPRRTEVNLADIPIVSYGTKQSYDSTLAKMGVASSTEIPKKYIFWDYVDPLDENLENDEVGLPVKRNPETGKFRLVEKLGKKPKILFHSNSFHLNLD